MPIFPLGQQVQTPVTPQVPGPVNIDPAASQSAAQSDPGTFDRWRSWLSQPEHKAAIIQTGIALMAPPQLGQSQFGTFANAIGQGVAAAGRQEKISSDEAIAEEERQRQLAKDQLDETYKLGSLDINRMDTESQIQNRGETSALARSRLGLDTATEARQGRLTDAQISNYESLAGDRLTKQAIAVEKQNAENAKLGLLGEKNRLLAERLKTTDANAKAAIDAKLKQIDAGVLIADRRIASANLKYSTTTANNRSTVAQKLAETAITFGVSPQEAVKQYTDIYNQLGMGGTVAQDGTEAGGGGSPVRVTSKAEYDALESGTVFIDPQGNQRTKP